MHICGSIVVDAPDVLKAAALGKGLRQVGGMDLELALAAHDALDAETLLQDPCLQKALTSATVRYVEMGQGVQEEEAEALARRYVQACGARPPELLFSIGDGVAAMASCIAGELLGIPLARIDAGLRSFDESSEAERARRWCDTRAAMHFASEPSGVENLDFEALDGGCAHLVGDLLLEKLPDCRNAMNDNDVLFRLGLEPGGYALACFEDEKGLQNTDGVSCSLEMGATLAGNMPVALRVTRKTRRRLTADGEAEQAFDQGFAAMQGVSVLENLPYAEYLALLANSRVVLSDSEGVQGEAAFFDVPCLFCADSSARIFYEERGTTTLVRRQKTMLQALLQDVQQGRIKRATPAVQELGSEVAEKIATLVKARLDRNGDASCGCSGNCSC